MNMGLSMPKRILHLVASSHGGAATHLRDLVLGLPCDRYVPTVAMPLDGGNVLPTDFTQVGVEFAPLSIAGGFAWREIWYLRQLLQAKKFHILHLHGARAALYGRLTASTLRRRPTVIFSIHGFATPFHPLPKRIFYLWLERTLQCVTDHTIAVAQAEADLFLSFGLTTPDKISVMPYGIDVKRFATPPIGVTHLQKTLGVGEQNPIILTVCRLNVPRDFVSLLTAFHSVLSEYPAARLLIVGDGPQRADVEALVSRLSLGQAVQITGFREDIPALMALADLYVLTSYGWEGYPISTIEAQASGLPVVVTDAGGSKEAVLHEKTGLVVPKRRADLLAEALLHLLRNAGLRRQMGKAGQQRVWQESTREQMIQKISHVYDSMLSHNV
jgi:glycosyltransferase involved in cell wall biosynthesis